MEVYIVNYIEKRPTKLNGTINIKACFEEIKPNIELIIFIHHFLKHLQENKTLDLHL